MKMLEEAIELYNGGEYEKAYNLFVDMAYERNAEACFYLGMMYFYGEGVDKDEDKCCDWWRKAAREGHQESAYRLSEIRASTNVTF